jgi:arylsulfatase A-like enzyme
MLVAVSLSVYAQPAPAPNAQPLNVILISWDGFDRSVLNELLGEQKLPNLASLVREGSLQEIQVVGHATVTKPGHPEMLTGLAASVTGVFSNARYRPIPEGYTIFERLQQHLGGPEGIRTIMLASKGHNVGGHGPAGSQSSPRQPAPVSGRSGTGQATRRAANADALSSEGEPFFLTRKHLDVFDSADRGASRTGSLCLKYLDRFKEPRFLAFFHFGDPDAAGHRYGMDSAEYRAAASACDGWLGKIVEWLRREGLYDKTLIYVTTDHGFNPHSRTHSHAPDSWLVTNDKAVARGGIIADIPATILARFGVDVGRLEPALVGTPLTDAAATGGRRGAVSYRAYPGLLDLAGALDKLPALSLGGVLQADDAVWKASPVEARVSLAGRAGRAWRRGDYVPDETPLLDAQPYFPGWDAFPPSCVAAEHLWRDSA